MQKKTERRPGLWVDSTKVQDFFCKKTGAHTIWAVRLADPMAGKSGRRGHATWPSFGVGFIRTRKDTRRCRAGQYETILL